ncbi:hypothetical protein Nepgr_032891 [Nepenthes gracilis]|uniref:Uncharacterized protein n=1 Tax=Nepenthes gracilis TaxID=150966 RepID=A0AAD3Y6F9_NEPGR|nr:hypothetical protein Nepgr_032891 [Nepenthes gracilis]
MAPGIADIASSLSPERLDELRQQYAIPGSMAMTVLGPTESARDPPSGFITVYEVHLKANADAFAEFWRGLGFTAVAETINAEGAKLKEKRDEAQPPVNEEAEAEAVIEPSSETLSELPVVAIQANQAKTLAEETEGILESGVVGEEMVFTDVEPQGTVPQAGAPSSEVEVEVPVVPSCEAQAPETSGEASVGGDLLISQGFPLICLWIGHRRNRNGDVEMEFLIVHFHFCHANSCNGEGNDQREHLETPAHSTSAAGMPFAGNTNPSVLYAVFPSAGGQAMVHLFQSMGIQQVGVCLPSDTVDEAVFSMQNSIMASCGVGNAMQKPNQKINL